MSIKALLPYVPQRLMDWWYIYGIFRSGLFDEQRYWRENPDVRVMTESSLFWRFRASRVPLLQGLAQLWTSPISHYVKHGASEGRNPAPWFSSKAYLNIKREDTSEGFINPLYHYAAYGRHEPWQGKAELNALESFWRDTLYLKGKYEASRSDLLESPQQQSSHKSILVIDDQVPHIKDGTGYPRANLILHTLVKLGFQVTLYPLQYLKDEGWAETYYDIPSDVEVVFELGHEGFGEFMQERSGLYGHILISRPHNMRMLKDDIDMLKKREGFNLIYDAEAIFANREKMQMDIKGDSMRDSDYHRILAEELGLARAADNIFAVSEGEAAQFREHKYDDVHVLGHAIKPVPTGRAFAERFGILFVGNLDDDASPNVDSMLWFVNYVLPLIKQNTGMQDVGFVMVGSNKSPLIETLGKKDGVTLAGQAGHISDYFDRARIFIAPTRFSAGIPHKVHEAAAHGLPTVATDILTEQLGWRNGDDLLSAPINDAQDFARLCVRLYSDEELWTRLRANALSRIEADCSEQVFEQVLRGIVDEDNCPC